jgi:hypothetical protein
MGGMRLIYYYKTKYVCIICRKVFKWHIPENIKPKLCYNKNHEHYLYKLELKYNMQKLCLKKIGDDIFNKRCPNFKENAILISPTFRSPKKTDNKGWYKNQELN